MTQYVAVPPGAQVGQMLALQTTLGHLYCRLTRADLMNRQVAANRFTPPPAPDMVPVPSGAAPGVDMWLQGEDGVKSRTILTVADIATGWVHLNRFTAAGYGGTTMTSNASSARAMTGNMEPCPVPEGTMPDPDHQGTMGRFWRCDLEPLRRKIEDSTGKSAKDGTLAIWLLEAPWAHPYWHSYVVALVHLRPWDGEPSRPVFYVEGGTHEMWLFALDTKAPRAEGVAGTANLLDYRLNPKNYAAQWRQPEEDGTATGQGESDRAALARVESALKACAAGQLTPDADGIDQWNLLFGDAMAKPGSKL